MQGRAGEHADLAFVDRDGPEDRAGRPDRRVGRKINIARYMHVPTRCVVRAAVSRPGSASATELHHWFWHDTQASDILREIGDRLSTMDDPSLKFTGEFFVVPRAEA